MNITDTEAHAAFVKRLKEMAFAMVRARDQGHDGRYYPSDTDITDIEAATIIIAHIKPDASR